MTATRRRGAALETAVLEAAWDLLVERGYSAMTYDELAAQAHTAKRVIYRRWPTKRELLFATLAHHGSTLPAQNPDTGSLRDDILALIRNSSSRLGDLTAIFSGLIGAHFDTVEATPRELRQALFGTRANAVDTALERARARGEIGPGEIPDRVVSVLYDLYRHEAIMTLTEIPTQTLVDIVDVVWIPLIQKYAGAPKP